MSKPEWLFNRGDVRQGIARELAEGVSTRIFLGAKAMLSVVRVDPHSTSDLHQHPEEQWGVLLEGECTRVQGGDEVEVEVGDFWHTPSNVPHAVRTGASSALILDFFSPPRAEYRAGSNSVSGVGRVSRVGEESSARIDDLGGAVLCDSAGHGRALPSTIRSLAGDGRITGPAFPVACAPGDNLWLHRAIYSAAPGDVLVASTGGFRQAGYWGEVLANAAQVKKLGGLVIDGCVRDGAELLRLGFPVFATGLCVRGTAKTAETTGSMGEPVRIGECTISQGDLVVGDGDGVVVLPRGEVDAIVVRAEERQRREAEVLRRLRDGERTVDLFGIAPQAQTLALHYQERTNFE